MVLFTYLEGYGYYCRRQQFFLKWLSGGLLCITLSDSDKFGKAEFTFLPICDPMLLLRHKINDLSGIRFQTYEIQNKAKQKHTKKKITKKQKKKKPEKLLEYKSNTGPKKTNRQTLTNFYDTNFQCLKIWNTYQQRRKKKKKENLLSIHRGPCVIVSSFQPSFQQKKKKKTLLKKNCKNM